MKLRTKMMSFAVATGIGCALLNVLSPLETRASGLDVQLKDLRNSFYHLSGSKDCVKLTGSEIKKFGRLTHCDPEEDHVMCNAKSGEKLFVFEKQEACDVSAKKGVDPTPAE